MNLKVKCGDANPKGNVEFTYKGGCRKETDIIEMYRCVGCGGWFHKECLIKHFELEKKHDWGRIEGNKEAFQRAIEIIDSMSKRQSPNYHLIVKALEKEMNDVVCTVAEGDNGGLGRG